MHVHTTVRLLMVASVLALAVWFLDRQRGKAPAEDNSGVLHIAAERVTGLTIRQDNLFVECVRDGQDWRIRRPIAARADEAAIDRILDVLAGMRREETITAAEREARDLTLRDYGLLDPRARLIVTDNLRRQSLTIGLPAPASELVYVQVEGEDDVVATTHALVEALPQELEQVRDRVVMPGEAERTARIEIRRPARGFVQLARADGRWMLLQPAETIADSARVARLLDALYHLRVRRFLWDPPVEGTDSPNSNGNLDASLHVAPYGLEPDEAVATVNLWQKNDEQGRKLILGKQTAESSDEVYAKTSDSPSIFTVDSAILDALAVSAFDLRSRTVFPYAPDAITSIQIHSGERKLALDRLPSEGWMLTDPLQAKADDAVVRELLRRLCRVTVIDFLPTAPPDVVTSLEHPTLAIHLAGPDGGSPPRSVAPRDTPESAATTDSPTPTTGKTLLLGAPSTNAALYYARLREDPTVFTVDAAIVRSLPDDPLAPLIYRDRTVLSIPPDNIWRLSRAAAGNEETIQRNDNGQWSVVSPPSNLVSTAVMEDILLLAANLRAVRIEALNPAQLSNYGLDAPAMSLTFGLKGAGGIQKTLVLGRTAEPDGVYAMIQGQDAVFVLGHPLINALFVRGLTLPPPDAATPPTAAPPPTTANAP